MPPDHRVRFDDNRSPVGPPRNHADSSFGVEPRALDSTSGNGQHSWMPPERNTVPTFSQINAGRDAVRSVLTDHESDSDEEVQDIVDDMFQLCLAVTQQELEVQAHGYLN